MTDLYLIAVGCNQRHPVIGTPRLVVAEAINAMEMDDLDVFTQSPILDSPPIGPSRRTYANGAAVVATSLSPPDLLARLHDIEAHFGRRRLGQRWGARVLDLDIVLWSGGIWASDRPTLAIPHLAMRHRDFVLTPAALIAPDWRDPVSGLSLRQLQSRLRRAKPLDARRSRH